MSASGPSGPLVCFFNSLNETEMTKSNFVQCIRNSESLTSVFTTHMVFFD